MCNNNNLCTSHLPTLHILLHVCHIVPKLRVFVHLVFVDVINHLQLVVLLLPKLLALVRSGVGQFSSIESGFFELLLQFWWGRVPLPLTDLIAAALLSSLGQPTVRVLNYFN